MASVSSPFLRLLMGNLADVPPAVRQRMLATIPTTPLSLAFWKGAAMVVAGSVLCWLATRGQGKRAAPASGEPG